MNDSLSAAGGAFMLLSVLFMAVTSTGSAEVIAVRPPNKNGPDHLGLWYNVLPAHRMAVITSGCVPFRSRRS